MGPLALITSCSLLALAACGEQPCDGGEPDPDGPVTRLDVALDTCNHRPVALARLAANTTGGKRQPIELDGSGSIDIDGAALSFAWSLQLEEAGVQLVNRTSPVATLTAEQEGSYVVFLVVSDGDLDSEPVRLVVDVRNAPPVADAGPDTPVPVGALATLDGRGSSDADGDPLTYTWYFEARPPGSSANLDDPTHPQPSFTVDQPGVYTLALRVFDGDDTSEPDRVRIGGGVTGGPPTANAGPDDVGVTGQTFHLDGRASSDPDGDALTYSWRWAQIPEESNLGPLTTTSTARPSFQPDVEGFYVAELVVDDGFYSSPADSVSITVVPGTGVPGDICEVAGCQSGAACFDGVCVGIGRLRFSLSWTVYSDFDLHVLTPEGVEIYFGNRSDGGGELDVDDCVSSNCLSAVHVENIVFAQEPPSGRYQVWVENYNGAVAGDYRIEVLGRARDQFTGSLPAVGGASSMRHAVIVP